jgi:uncharacterized membrane protein
MAQEDTVGIEQVPAIRRVAVDRPWHWLEAGWRDFTRTPALGLSYGVGFSAIGCVITYWLYSTGTLYLIMPVAAGFALLGPAAAVGLYDISRRLEAGQPASLGAIVPAVLARADTFAAMGLVLMLFFLAWMEIALLIFALFFGSGPASAENFVEQVFFAPESLPFIVTGTVAGAILAAAVFAISAVSLPLLLDRNVGVPLAVVTSLRAVNRNRKALALWATIVAVFFFLGVTTFFAGLVITLPVIGHATWHAYRDLVAPGPGTAEPSSSA